MRTNILLLTLAAALLGVAAPTSAPAAVVDQSFTYQGQLNDSNGPANGVFDFRFRLYTTASGTSGAVFSFVTNANVQVTNGRFTTALNFSNTFSGTAYWLRVDVRTNSPDNSISFDSLAPRQSLTAVPYASYATNAAYTAYADSAGTAGTADTASSVAAGAITAAGISNAAITTSKLAADIAVWVKTPTNLYNLGGGPVGIGTTTPGAALEIETSGTNDAVLRITSPGNGVYPNVYNSTLQLVDTNSNGWSISKDQANNLSLRDAKTRIERVRFQANGNAGLGGITPTNVASRVLCIMGDSLAAQYPGTAGVVLNDPLHGSIWSLATYTTGDLHIEKVSGSGNEVYVPILTVVGGSDIAEPFNINSVEVPKPGMVVCIDPERVGELCVSRRAYDSTVAGIVSGAGGVKTGLKLTQEGTAASGTHPVALTGRVYCYVDAEAGGPVVPGDLLTTSGTPGHAMKAGDHRRANGAILGKAMSSLKEGKGLVLVLVTLQ